MKNRKEQPGGIFEQIAAQYGVSAGEVVRDIQAAVDDAWDNPDPAIRARQRQLFPSGKPTVEDFIRIMADEVKNK